MERSDALPCPSAYGFRASEDGNALEVSEPEMEVVWRIFRSVP